MPDRWRLFCALELPANVRTHIVSHARRLQEKFPYATASWTREENLHLTVKFIGEVEASRAPSLSNAVTRAASSVESFVVLFDHPGAFPKRVLWIGVEDPSGNLSKLQQQLEIECERDGFPREERAYHPHLTLARLRKPQGTQTLITAHKELPFAAVVVMVSELVVIRSELSSKGSTYTVVSRHRLGK